MCVQCLTFINWGSKRNKYGSQLSGLHLQYTPEGKKNDNLGSFKEGGGPLVSLHKEKNKTNQTYIYITLSILILFEHVMHKQLFMESVFLAPGLLKRIKTITHWRWMFENGKLMWAFQPSYDRMRRSSASQVRSMTEGSELTKITL